MNPIFRRNILFVPLLPAMCAAQTFNDFITRLNISPAGERPAIVDSFMSAAESFPLIEFDTLAHFIYRGAANSVNVPAPPLLRCR